MSRSPIRIDRLDDMNSIWHTDLESTLHQSLLEHYHQRAIGRFSDWSAKGLH
jgi:hypothetical protein